MKLQQICGVKIVRKEPSSLSDAIIANSNGEYDDEILKQIRHVEFQWICIHKNDTSLSDFNTLNLVTLILYFPFSIPILCKHSIVRKAAKGWHTHNPPPLN